MTEPHRIVETADTGGRVLATAWVSDDAGMSLCVYLQDFLEDPAGDGGPRSRTLEVELGVSVPLEVAARALDVPEGHVLSTVVTRYRGAGREMLSWARELPDARPWSHLDML